MDEYEVNIVLTVDPDANFFEAGRETDVQALMELLKDTLYDVDDIKVKYIEVERR